MVRRARLRSWRTCPICRSRATKIFSLTDGKLFCQICGHRYETPDVSRETSDAAISLSHRERYLLDYAIERFLASRTARLTNALTLGEFAELRQRLAKQTTVDDQIEMRLGLDVSRETKE